MVTEVEWENLEQVARALGERWARQLRSECPSLTSYARPWPNTLGQARKLLDEMLGRKISEERLEPLALIVERSARTAWHKPMK